MPDVSDQRWLPSYYPLIPSPEHARTPPRHSEVRTKSEPGLHASPATKKKDLSFVRGFSFSRNLYREPAAKGYWERYTEIFWPKILRRKGEVCWIQPTLQAITPNEASFKGDQWSFTSKISHSDNTYTTYKMLMVPRAGETVSEQIPSLGLDDSPADSKGKDSFEHTEIISWPSSLECQGCGKNQFQEKSG